MTLLQDPAGNEFFVEHEIRGVCESWGVVLPEDTLPSLFSLPVSSADPLSFNELTVSALKSDVDTSRPDLFDSLVSYTMKGADLGFTVEPFYRKKIF